MRRYFRYIQSHSIVRTMRIIRPNIMALKKIHSKTKTPKNTVHISQYYLNCYMNFTKGSIIFVQKERFINQIIYYLGK